MPADVVPAVRQNWSRAFPSRRTPLDSGRRKRSQGVLHVSIQKDIVRLEKKPGAAILLQRSLENCTGSGHRTTTSSTGSEARKASRFLSKKGSRLKGTNTVRGLTLIFPRR
jgi:hypothetical protein